MMSKSLLVLRCLQLYPYLGVLSFARILVLENLFSQHYEVDLIFVPFLFFELKNATILDGFCGTGAVGFEALSRGAKFITFIDSNKEHLNIAKKNSELLGTNKNSEFICTNLEKPLWHNTKNYDLVFLDPPYKNSILENTLKNLSLIHI